MDGGILNVGTVCAIGNGVVVDPTHLLEEIRGLGERGVDVRLGDNLLVSVCMSASHIAMSSIRMESSYVVMGEAAGIAASHAVKSDKNVHQLDVEAVLADMSKDGVVTEWDGTGYGPNSRRTWKPESI